MPVSEISAQFGAILSAFETVVGHGLIAITPHVRFWTAFAVLMYGIGVGVGILRGSGSLIEWALWSTVKISVAVFLVTELAGYAFILRDSMIRLGAAMAGSTETNIVLNPAEVLRRGVVTVQVIFDMIARASTSWIGVITAIPNMMVLGIAAFATLSLYVVLAVSISVALIEWTITLLFAAVTIPMGVAHHAFSFLSERGISGLLNHSIRLAVLSFLALVTTPFLTAVALKSADWGIALSTLFAMAVIATLFVKTPSLVAGLLSGMPRLSAGSMGSGLITGAALTAGAGVAASRAVTGTIRGGTAIGSGVRTLAGHDLAGKRQLLGQGTRSLMSQSSYGQAASGGRDAAQRFLSGKTQGGRPARIVQAMRNAQASNPD